MVYAGNPAVDESMRTKVFDPDSRRRHGDLIPEAFTQDFEEE